METLKVCELKDHPRNHEFFDDMTGSKWQEFLDSVKHSGIIEPIVITTDKVIVSGHQRVRACRELNIAEVPCISTGYASDDPRCVKDLIETNVRQRGNPGGTDEQILARVNTLNEYYGIGRGGDHTSSGFKSKTAPGSFAHDDDTRKTLYETCELAGTTVSKYQKAQQLAKAIPEARELIEEGVVSPKAVRVLIAKLSPDEQRELVDMLPRPEDGKHVTTPEVQEYIDKLKAKETELREKSREIKAKNDELKARDSELAEVRDELNKTESQRQLEIKLKHDAEASQEAAYQKSRRLEDELAAQKRHSEVDDLKTQRREERIRKLENDIYFVMHDMETSIDGKPLPLKIKLDAANDTIARLQQQLEAAGQDLSVSETAMAQDMSPLQKNILMLQKLAMEFAKKLAEIVIETDEHACATKYSSAASKMVDYCNAALAYCKENYHDEL